MSATPVNFAAIAISGSASGHTICAATGAIGVGYAYLTDENGVRLQDENNVDLMVPGVSSDLLDIDMATRSAGGI